MDLAMMYHKWVNAEHKTSLLLIKNELHIFCQSETAKKYWLLSTTFFLKKAKKGGTKNVRVSFVYNIAIILFEMGES